MPSSSSHPVRVETAAQRGIAAVRATLIAEVLRRFVQHLDQVYAASRADGLALDGQNVFVYRAVAPDGSADVDFGLGATTHWGDYAALGAAQRVAMCGTEYHICRMTQGSEYLEFIYTRVFVATAKALLGDDDLRELEERLIANPRAGVVERGTGGVRKIRVGLQGRGRSGGARVIYFYRERRGRIYLLLAYPKNEKTSLTQAERDSLRALTAALEEEA